ncbi:RpiB/LacA/LacB family sugar-phosphate isomerase, partial [archaeon]|nr:RpiB/LacA/LacB family sugar-phosphate isomerase [archaeon]
IALSGDWMKDNEAKKILKTWLETKYSNEPRHTRRLKKIQEMEK